MSQQSEMNATLRETMNTPEFRAAFRERLLRGEVKKAEIDLIRSLDIGLVDEDTERRAALRKVDRRTLNVLMDLSRCTESAPESLRLIVSRNGQWIGVAMPAHPGEDYSPNPGDRPPLTNAALVALEDDDLLPVKPVKAP